MFKTILYGQFKFGSERSFEMVRGTSNSRLDSHYRFEVIFDHEDAFVEGGEDGSYFMITKKGHSSDLDKAYRNTVGQLEHIAEFATSGKARLWLVKDGKLKKKTIVEPRNHHTCVRHYLSGKKALKQNEFEKAIKHFTDAIESNDQHAQAYEERGRTLLKLDEYENAMRDFTKSIELAVIQPEPYYERALLHRKLNQLEKAADDFTQVCKYSIPHQPLYWDSKRQRAECLVALDRYKEAESEWRLMDNMNFKKDSSQYAWAPYYGYRHGEALVKLKKYKDAYKVLDQLKKNFYIVDDTIPLKLHDVLYLRYLAMQGAKMKGETSALKEAAKAGSKEAKSLLKK